MKKKTLTKEQKHILLEKGTERPFSGKYHNHKSKGTYTCAQCGSSLFSSQSKFDSGTGWPSFTQALNPEALTKKKDFKLLLPRTEVLCAKCGGHLGHVFSDGPKKDQHKKGTGKRYCINSLALDFKKS